MKSTSKKTFRELSLPFLSEVYDIIDTVCRKHNVSCYLIGAQARDINLLESGVRPTRGTMDIDFAIMLPNMSTYSNIFSDLLGSGFRKTQMPYRLIYDKTNTVIDILPFGEIEEGEGTVKFTERETELSVLGFKEVSQIAQNITIEGKTVRVTPLEGIFILKLISWNEKPLERAKDLTDLRFILENYFEINKNRFYDDHVDCVDELSDKHFELEAGARLLGRDMAVALKLSEPLKNHIIRVLDTRLQGNIGDLGHSLEFSDDRDKLDTNLIKHIVTGINERI
ncbi:MAG: nucleotidyl transferase AbiEii/AbiGii toxin family protein [Flavobacteriales bacterium]